MKRADAQKPGTAPCEARHEHAFAQLHGGRRLDPCGRPWMDGLAVEHKTYVPSGVGCVKLGDAGLAERGARKARGIACESFAPAHWAGTRESDLSTT